MGLGGHWESTQRDGREWQLRLLLAEAGYTFVVSFSNPGTYAYNCSIHPDMKGTVNVT